MHPWGISIGNVKDSKVQAELKKALAVQAGASDGFPAEVERDIALACQVAQSLADEIDEQRVDVMLSGHRPGQTLRDDTGALELRPFDDPDEHQQREIAAISVVVSGVTPGPVGTV